MVIVLSAGVLVLNNISHKIFLEESLIYSLNKVILAVSRIHLIK